MEGLFINPGGEFQTVGYRIRSETKCFGFIGRSIRILGRRWLRRSYWRGTELESATRRYGCGSWSQGIGRKPAKHEGIGNGDSGRIIMGRWYRWTGPITIGLRGEDLGVCSWAISTMRGGKSLGDSIRMRGRFPRWIVLSDISKRMDYR